MKATPLLVLFILAYSLQGHACITGESSTFSCNKNIKITEENADILSERLEKNIVVRYFGENRSQSDFEDINNTANCVTVKKTIHHLPGEMTIKEAHKLCNDLELE